MLLLATLACASSPAPARADPIDRIVRSELKRQFSPGIGIAVVKDGQVVKASGYGFANVEHRARATGLTFFQTASVGKQFTAALVMLLVRDGKLRLDDPVSRHLPGTPVSWQDITVRHLLTHTSGLARTDEKIDLRKDYTEQELLASAYALPLRSAPGHEHAYSNLGYQVLGVLCSAAGGRFWGEQLRDRVFKPLGMRARVISERDIVPNRAAGYDRFDGVLENQAWVAPSQNTTADGSLYVSAGDMARWSKALDDQRILGSEEKEALWKPTLLADGRRVGYGLGWRLFNKAGHRLVRHRGDWQGFTTHLLHLPEDRLTISVLMNRARGQPHVIADRIAAHFIPALREPAVVAPSAAVLARTPMHVHYSVDGLEEAVLLAPVAPGIRQARLTLPGGMQSFTIADADRAVATLGARFDEAAVRPGKAQFLEVSGEDLWLDMATPGEVLIELDLRGGKAPRLEVRPPQRPHPGS